VLCILQGAFAGFIGWKWMVLVGYGVLLGICLGQCLGSFISPTPLNDVPFQSLYNQWFFVVFCHPTIRITSALTGLNGKSRQLLSLLFFLVHSVIFPFLRHEKYLQKYLIWHMGALCGEKRAKPFVCLKWQTAVQITAILHTKTGKPQGQNLFINKPANQITRDRERTRSRVL